MRENTDQKNSEYEDFSCSESLQVLTHFVLMFKFIPILFSILQYLLKHRNQLERWHKMSQQSQPLSSPSNTTAQKMKFSFKDFFSKCEQIRNKLQIWSHLVKKSLMKNFIFLAVCYSVSLNAACLFGSFKIALMKCIQLYQKLNK